PRRGRGCGPAAPGAGGSCVHGTAPRCRDFQTLTRVGRLCNVVTSLHRGSPGHAHGSARGESEVLQGDQGREGRAGGCPHRAWQSDRGHHARRSGPARGGYAADGGRRPAAPGDEARADASIPRDPNQGRIDHPNAPSRSRRPLMAAAPAYFDTSVLLKRYINEPGSVRAREALRRFRLVCSAIAPVEATSMVGRRLRSGELSAPAARAILDRLHDDRAQWELVEVQPAVLDRAEGLVFDVGVATL